MSAVLSRSSQPAIDPYIPEHSEHRLRRAAIASGAAANEKNTPRSFVSLTSH